MSSITLANNEETPSWDQIRCALSSLLSRFDLDLSNVGSSTNQRLQYEDFEMVFYHLFLVIDPVDTKRKFRSLFPARNQEEKGKFIELSVRAINDRRLSAQKVSAAQLRMCGGEPFRRLVATLLLVAIDKELETMRRMAPDCRDLALDRSDNSSLDFNVQLYRNELIQKQANIENLIRHMRDSMDHLRALRVKSSETRQQHEEKWKCLASKFDMGQYSHSLRHVQAICRLLLSRLEEANANIKRTSQQIKEIQVPQEKQTEPTAPSSGRKKRLSQYIREVRDRLDSSQELSIGADQSRIVNRIRNQLNDYDLGISKLIDLWKEEADKADEERLKNPEILEKFTFLERLIPKIDLKLGDDAMDSETKVSLQDIEKILTKYPDNRYDDREIIQASKNYFN